MNLATHPWDYLIVSGLYAGNLIADKDTITLNNPFCDVFTASYNNSGQIQEFTSMGGTAEEYPQAMAYDKDGHVFVAGIFRDTTNLQHATLYTPSGSEEIFLSKLHHCSKHRVVFTCDTVFSEGDILMLGVKDTYKEYTWDDGRSVAPNYIIYYNKTYQLLVSDSLGCVYRDSITIRQIPVVPDWQIRAELFNEKSGHHLLFADSFTAARRED